MSFVPVTPGGTPVMGLAARTKDQAINRLLIDASHMPYVTWESFQRRGYTIEEWPDDVATPTSEPEWSGCGASLTDEEKLDVLRHAGRL
jgi:hypothetical protein